MTHTDMTKPFSSNPKLEDWVPSEQQIQTITAARELWDLVPEEEGDDLNLFKINALDVRSHLHPVVLQDCVRASKNRRIGLSLSPFLVIFQ